MAGVQTFREARDHLSELLDSQEPVFVGPHRKPKGVIMSIAAFEAIVTRVLEVTAADGSVRAEGLKPSVDVGADLARYVAGDLTLEEVERRVLARAPHGQQPSVNGSRDGGATVVRRS